MVTAGTYLKQPFFTEGERLGGLHQGLLKYAEQYGWQLEAWAVFPNHYHFVGHSPEHATDATSLSAFIKHFHGRASAWLNRLDAAPGRKVWHNYWDTRLTSETSYLARLHYVHQNPVRHGIAPVANQYRWCSAAWFERTARPAMVKTIYGFNIDDLDVPDDF
ncbi:MAG TPA: transposase [Kiritimatiellia bacterium]|nr:transposase [Kiritimatiellia bacterium]HMP33407.1 transposase [Kiritimatiellia bacterium]